MDAVSAIQAANDVKVVSQALTFPKGSKENSWVVMLNLGGRTWGACGDDEIDALRNAAAVTQRVIVDQAEAKHARTLLHLVKRLEKMALTAQNDPVEGER